MKRFLLFLIGLLLIPSLLFAQVDYSGKGLYSFITTNYHDISTYQAYVNGQGFLKFADLTPYRLVIDSYTTSEVDTLLSAKLDADIINGYYTAATVDGFLALKANVADVYTTTAVDLLLAPITLNLNTINANLATIESELNESTLWRADSYIYGFPEVSKPTISYDSATRTLSIGANYVYCAGTKYYKAPATITHPATDGVHYFYYDSAGTLTTSQSLWSILSTAQIAFVVYNNNNTVKGFCFNELHGMVMDCWTHLYEHVLYGAKASSVFTIGDYLLQPASPTTAGNQFSISGGNIYDEDNKHIIAPLADGSMIPIFWRDGTDGVWFWSEETIPVMVGTTFPKYNHISGGVWTTTEVTAGSYLNAWLCATGAEDITYRYIIVMGQFEDSTLAAATARNLYNLSLGDFFAEVVPIQRITFRTSNGYTNALGRCRIEAVSSLYGTSITLGNVNSLSHNSQTGRSDDGCHPSAAITTDTTTFGGNLTGADDTVQKALETLDNLSGLPATNAITKIYGDSDIVGTGTGEVWIKGTNGVIITRTDNTLEVDANVDLTDYYTKSETDTAIASATASVSVNQTVSVTAGENLTAGDVVSLINQNNVVSAVKNNLTVSSQPNGSEVVFNSAATLYCSATKIDSSRFVVAYRSDDGYPYAKVGTVSGSSITWGSATAAFENITATYISSCLISTDKVLVCYNDATNQKGRMVVLTFSGSTITVGAVAAMRDGATCYSISVSTLSTDTACVVYNIYPNTYAKVITVSNTTPTANAESSAINDSSTLYLSSATLSSSAVIIAFQDSTNSNYGTAQVLSISGTTITPGTEYVFLSANAIYISTCAFSPTSGIVSFVKNLDGYAYAKTFANSSGTITYGAETTSLSTTNSAYDPKVVTIDSTRAMWYSGNTTTGNNMSRLLTVSGTDITVGTNYIFGTSGQTASYLGVCYLGNQKSIVAYKGASNYGYSVVNTWATPSYASISGVSTGAYSAGQTATILINGLQDGYSSLVTGSQYFLAADFSLTTAPVSLTPIYYNSSTATGEIYIGTAKSATQLYVSPKYK